MLDSMKDYPLHLVACTRSAEEPVNGVHPNSQPDSDGGVLKAHGFDTEQQVDELMQAMVGDEENHQWLTEHGVQHTERWPDGLG